MYCRLTSVSYTFSLDPSSRVNNITLLQFFLFRLWYPFSQMYQYFYEFAMCKLQSGCLVVCRCLGGGHYRCFRNWCGPPKLSAAQNKQGSHSCSCLFFPFSFTCTKRLHLHFLIIYIKAIEKVGYGECRLSNPIIFLSNKYKNKIQGALKMYFSAILCQVKTHFIARAQYENKIFKKGKNEIFTFHVFFFWFFTRK